MSASLRELIDNTDCVPESMEHDSPDASATGHPITEPESVQSVLEENHAPPAMLQFAKTRKLYAKRSDPRNGGLNCFYPPPHSPTLLEEMSDTSDTPTSPRWQSPAFLLVDGTWHSNQGL
ncbi:hypothetical protein Tco_0725006 [Tanacetum coccineum]|uniref:tRNA-uridine aminocarboxypropyltransferase n=1 Tax=Tanacetum coccineum TaxID=301880 RepID=A0ABQ4YCG8_9ASTR